MANLTKQPLLTFLQWGAIVQSERRTNRHPAYHFYAGSDSQIHLFKFEFDVHTMQYSCKASTMAMPNPNPNPNPDPDPNPNPNPNPNPSPDPTGLEPALVRQDHQRARLQPGGGAAPRLPLQELRRDAAARHAAAAAGVERGDRLHH